MAYTRVKWEDLPSTATPRNAANLNNMDKGIKTNDDKLEGNTPMGNIVVDSIKSKNMFNVETCVGGNLDNGVVVGGEAVVINSTNAQTGTIVYTSNQAWRGVVSDYIEVNEGEQYILNFTRSTTSILTFAVYFNSSKQVIGNAEEISYQTPMTIPTSVKYIRFILEPNTTISEQITLSNIQLEKGNTATNFCPHQIINYEDTGWIDANLSSNVSNFYLRPKYRKIGKIVQVIGEVDCTDLSQNAEILTGLPQPVGLIRIPTTYSNGVAQTYLSNNGTLCCVYGISNTLFLNFMYLAN